MRHLRGLQYKFKGAEGFRFRHLREHVSPFKSSAWKEETGSGKPCLGDAAALFFFFSWSMKGHWAWNANACTSALQRRDDERDPGSVLHGEHLDIGSCRHHLHPAGRSLLCGLHRHHTARPHFHQPGELLPFFREAGTKGGGRLFNPTVLQTAGIEPKLAFRLMTSSLAQFTVQK